MNQPYQGNDEDTYFCQQCSEKLDPKRMVWLELNLHTGLYTDKPIENEADSQGLFTFGSACARSVLKRGGKLKRRGI